MMEFVLLISGYVLFVLALIFQWKRSKLTSQLDVRGERSAEDNMRRDNDRRLQRRLNILHVAIKKIYYEVRAMKTALEGRVGEGETTRRSLIEGHMAELFDLTLETNDFYLSERGELALIPSDFQFGHLLEDVRGEVAEEIGVRGIDFELEFLKQSDLRCSADYPRVKQVYKSLLRNALQVTSDGGAIKLSVEITEVAGQTVLASKIAETPAGAFKKPFVINASGSFALHNLTADVMNDPSQAFFYLRLYMARAVIEMMSGTLVVKSKGDKGATFDFDMILAPASKPSLVDRISVLLIDDDPFEMAMFQKMAINFDDHFEFTFADEISLNVLDEKVFDWLITDQNLVNTTGIEICSGLVRKGAATKFAIMSGTVSDDLREAAAAVGIDLFLTKPFDPGTVKSLLEEIQKRAK
ncbi:MAG: response regulator [Proteobacteria bacterium]|nr:MAG: response regulator [Pseudomonadota bacterium]